MGSGEAIAARVQARLERMDFSLLEVSKAAGIPSAVMAAIADGKTPLPRGQKLLKLAEALGTSASYLIGLDPDDPLPAEWLEEDQGALGLLAGDEETLLRAYRRLDFSHKGALLLIVQKMAPEPEMKENKLKARRNPG